MTALASQADGQGIAIIFSHMKKQIDDYIKKYGEENTPPPWQVFTIANDVKPGNLHVVQKVFEGPFEVSKAQNKKNNK
jgi:mannosyl-oligosaccharide glucosidase